MKINASGMDKTLGIKHVDMFAAHSQRHVELGAGNAGSAGPHDNNLHILQLAARQLCGVQQGGAGNHGRAMLVVQGYGNDFDINKLNYDKIIIMTDADVDGAHIATLLLTFFYRFYPDLINEGHIYIAIPPLYRVGEGKHMQYLYSDEELNRYRKKHTGKFTIQRYKGLGEMDADQLYETTMNPESRVLKQVSINSIVEANKLTQTLMGTEVAPRREYIETHSTDAVLDI